jgi:hypothetical protein
MPLILWDCEVLYFNNPTGIFCKYQNASNSTEYDIQCNTTTKTDGPAISEYE